MVSVIVPVYNVEKYLRYCVQSIRMLKTNVEILLIDDGSTDCSGTICDALAKEDARVRVVHQKNMGLSAARNTGIQQATGEYLLFVDSDDFLNPEATDCMLRECMTGLPVIMGFYNNYYDDRQRFEPENCGDFDQINGSMSIDRFLDLVPGIGGGCYMMAPRFAVKRDFLLKNKLMFFPGIYHEDEEWTQRMLCAIEEIDVTKEFFYQYRQCREGSITGSIKPKHIWDTFTIMERTQGLMESFQAGTMQYTYLGKRMAQMLLGNILNTRILNKEQRKTAFSEMERFLPLCIDYFTGLKGKSTRFCIRLFGIKTACYLLWGMRKIVNVLHR